MKNIYKYKKISIIIVMLLFIILTLIEMIKYFFVDSNLFGLIYLLLNLVIIFLLVPIAYNYNRYYSAQRISKLIIIVILGFFSSYLLNIIVLNNMIYKDCSKQYIESIFLIKNIIKGLIYIFVSIFTVFEFKIQKLIQNNGKTEDKSKKKKKK